MNKFKKGQYLISKRDRLQSSPIMSGDVLEVIEENSETVYVIRLPAGGRWALAIKDFGDTYDTWPADSSTQNFVTVVLNSPEETPARIDSHYDFFYDITPSEAAFLQLKVDPYFIAKQWRIGTRDPSGVLFHILKTIARFGDKNTKEREIKAIYLQIKRLAELEGVSLEEESK